MYVFIISVKQKLLDSKKRKVAEVQPSSNSSRNIVDIHAIMTKAIGINRKVMKDSSSSEDDSDDSCTWDDWSKFFLTKLYTNVSDISEYAF